ncbi:MAG TPA: trehalose-6-phosphate synthase [Phycisphaerales bacterium]|nr:trehalose-6-phosphate synthase [Phycisphaerales bacterium]
MGAELVQAGRGTDSRIGGSGVKTGRGRLIVVANRLPVHRVKRKGRSVWETSPGGVVSALRPLVTEAGGAWVGWSGTTGRAPAAFEFDTIQIRPVSVTAEQVEKYYGGFSNATLWPLYHDCVRTPQFHRRWWWPYVDVNRQFAEATAQEARPGDTVWVHDYQLQLVPGMLRELMPEVRIGFFMHIPFPPLELFAQLPWRREILSGMMGSDLVGFQTPQGAKNFAAACRRYGGARGSDRELEFRGRKVRVGPFSISIDIEHTESTAMSAPVQERAEELRRGVSPNLNGRRKILLGVDRLDYTKGIEIRLRAFEELLRRGVHTVDSCVMVQIAVPSRETVGEYAELRAYVEQLTGRINGEYGEAGKAAVHYLRRNLDFEELVAYYRAADVMLVTPLRDGMNLVAKEYVIAKTDDVGTLVLSEFAGAAQELGAGSLLVNPHDIDGLAATMEVALSMEPTEARRRMGLLQRAVRKNDVYGWADSFLGALTS